MQFCFFPAGTNNKNILFPYIVLFLFFFRFLTLKSSYIGNRLVYNRLITELDCNIHILYYLMTQCIQKFAILGERCSGTNFLEETISTNFNINYTAEYGGKHFFCYNDYGNKESTSNTLFIGIIRNPIYWLNSFSKELHHVPEINRKSLHNFLFNEFYLK